MGGTDLKTKDAVNAVVAATSFPRATDFSRLSTHPPRVPLTLPHLRGATCFWIQTKKPTVLLRSKGIASYFTMMTKKVRGLVSARLFARERHAKQRSDRTPRLPS